MTFEKQVETKKNLQKKRGVITVDLGELKVSWVNYCQKNKITPSRAFRQIVAKLTGAGEGGKVYQIQEESLPDKKKTSVW